MIRELARAIGTVVFLFIAVVIVGAGFLAVVSGIIRWIIDMMVMWRV